MSQLKNLGVILKYNSFTRDPAQKIEILSKTDCEVGTPEYEESTRAYQSIRGQLQRLIDEAVGEQIDYRPNSNPDYLTAMALVTQNYALDPTHSEGWYMAETVVTMDRETMSFHFVKEF